MQYYGIDWLATVCGVTGVLLLGNKNKYGFLIFMVASASWVSFGVLTSSLAVIIGSSIFFFMHLRGWLKWRRDEREVGFMQTQEINVAK
jgi:hypothetical protein